MLSNPIGKLPHGTKVIIKCNPRAYSYALLSAREDRIYFEDSKFYIGYVDTECGLWIQVEHPAGNATRMGKSILILPYYDIALCIKYVGDKK